MRKGIHYNQLNPEQIKDLEESGDIDKELSVEARSIDTQVMNRPTTKLIIQNLMENGIKDADGQTIGKTIILPAIMITRLLYLASLMRCIRNMAAR